ncbi:MAG: hypothetical protein QOE70_4161 [Chthoniobacter sp.]|jgi:hypothetical protein|nr:hypothetical protein [Chthoniobacter sp.]
MPPHLNEWFASKPHPVFVHSALGSFAFEGGVWTSDIPQGAHSLELSLAGGESAPYEKLVTAAAALLERFAEVKDTAIAFLTSQDEAPSREDFICHSMELLREDAPNHFSLSFILFGDLGGIWRVEFEDGVPIFLARDD